MSTKELPHPGRNNSYYDPKEHYAVGKNGIFVFGSNLAGRHGKGAALTALRYGARYGTGIGPVGRSYAIPTKDGRLSILDILTIESYAWGFVHFTQVNPQLHFLVTPIGTGLARYKDSDMAPMFRGAKNCWFSRDWKPFLE